MQPHRPRSAFLLIGLALFALCLSTGCATSPPAAACHGHDDCFCPPQCCPGGQCPVPPREFSGADALDELGNIKTAAEPNREALEETKGGPCLPCQQQRRPQLLNRQPPAVYVSPPIVRPAATPARAAPAPTLSPSAVAANPEKSGTYHCTRCGEPTVGRQWHTTFTDGGEAATFLCRRCWARSTPDEREAGLAAYLQRGNYPADKRLRLTAAVKAANY